MKVDLSKVKVGDKIWTIEEGLTKVLSTDYSTDFPIETEEGSFTLEGKFRMDDKYPSAFLEYPFKEQPIEKDTLVWYKDYNHESWRVGYYSHFEDDKHFCFAGSGKSTEKNISFSWNIVTTENPFL